MSAKEKRERVILERLAEDGSLSVASLAGELRVSEVTVRSTLRSLEARGLLTRTHGGARASSFQSVLERQREHPREKEAIAALAATLVADDDSIMIEAGTTTSLVISHLSGLRRLRVVTNSTLAFATARLSRDLDVTLLGGHFDRGSESLAGPQTLRLIDDYNVRLAFVGTDGFTIEQGLTASFTDGAAVIQRMFERAEETWLLADSSKFGRAGFSRVLPLGKLAGLVTDAGMDPDDVAALRDCIPRVLVAGGGDGQPA